MIKAGQIDKGTALLIKGQPFVCIDREFVNPGKGSAFVRLKLKSPSTGQVLAETMKSQDNAEDITVEDKDLQYLYNDGDLYYFMDPESYELIPINKSDLSDNFKFVKENTVCKILSYKGNVFGVEPPTSVTLEVTQTDPGFKGDTATNATKPAVLETGAEIKVPLFIEEGEMVIVDTRTGEYLSRA